VSRAGNTLASIASRSARGGGHPVAEPRGDRPQRDRAELGQQRGEKVRGPPGRRAAAGPQEVQELRCTAGQPLDQHRIAADHAQRERIAARVRLDALHERERHLQRRPAHRDDDERVVVEAQIGRPAERHPWEDFRLAEASEHIGASVAELGE
jgi:hypothetical protein